MSELPKFLPDRVSPVSSMTVIEAGGNGVGGVVPWRELWSYRELLWIFAVRDLKVRYKQTIAGVGWVLLQPILSTVVFLLLLNVLRVNSGGTPSSETGAISMVLTILAGVVLWRMFSQVVQQGSESIVSNQSLVTKVYFPRLVLPASPILSGLVDLGVGVLLIFALQLWFPAQPGIQVVYGVLFVMLVTLLGLGVGIWLSALNTMYRDIRQLVPFFLQLWFFLSPVIYPSSNIPSRFRVYYDLNPVVCPLEGFRWALLGGPLPSLLSFCSSLVATGVLLVTGARYFRSVERRFADWI